MAGEQYPTDLLRVKLALRGASRETPQPVRKLPITIDILRQMLKHVRRRFDSNLIMAVMTLAFFGCFRMGELCLPDSVPFNSTSHLCLGDVTVDRRDKTLTVFLKRSKTDVNNAGVSVFVGCSGELTCCAFCAMSHYIKFRKSLAMSDDDDAPSLLFREGDL